MPHQTTDNQGKTNQLLIFIDLDGVVADFEGHARREKKYKPDGKLDYDALDYTWWVTMPAFPRAKEFYDAACRMSVTKFLSGPTLSEDCFAGKAHWVQAFVPERGNAILGDLIICRSAEKFYLAHPGRILIDDRADNISEWEAAGGIGIHHTGDFKDTLKRLQEAVAKLTASSKPSPAKKWTVHKGPR